MRNYDSYKKNLNVLFVKSDSYSRKVSLKVLQKSFNNITVAQNGLEGYRMFMKNKNCDDNKFDLVISDVDLEYVDGIAMLERIRKTDDTPFIFLTTDNNYKTVLKAAKLHIISYIIKPLAFSNVCDILNKSCEKLYTNYVKNIESKKVLN